MFVCFYIMVVLVQGMKVMPQILISLQKGIKHNNTLQRLITTQKNAAYKPKTTIETLESLYTELYIKLILCI